ncbi:MAG: SurA N-terminal domain-containing protein, partial [Verrucomicrobiota bacterium]|nr:SurA N-terminal domain-containing protein [Verrucomicrobiota bacterium]
MAMMISKFNKMLHNRVLWIVILIIVVFAFVVWGMVWPSQLDQTAQDNAQGILNGERISYAQFRNAYMNAYLAYTLGTLGQNAPATAETESLIRRMAWLRLATLREAAQFGITTSDEELAAVLRANFSDRETGYNPQYYQGFAQNVLYPMGYSINLLT